MDIASVLNGPIKLLPNRIPRPYTGGMLLDIFRGTQKGNEIEPEDWVLSTISVRYPRFLGEGISRVIVEGQSINLVDVLKMAPEKMLGVKHLHRFGMHAALLVKMIDCKERLRIQAHPSADFARKHLGGEFGKTEGWIVLGTRETGEIPPSVYIGLKENVSEESFWNHFTKRDGRAMLDCLHRIPVKAGDVFFIPAGTLHTVGAGVFLVEIQEPSDWTISLELELNGRRFSEENCHLGLGFESVKECFKFKPESLEKVIERFKQVPVLMGEKGHPVWYLFPSVSIKDYFSVFRIDVADRIVLPLSEVFHLAIIINGQGKIKWTGGVLDVKCGETFFFPAILSEILLTSETGLSALICCPPTTNSKSFSF